MIRLLLLLAAIVTIEGNITYIQALQHTKQVLLTNTNNQRADINTLCEVVDNQEFILNAMTDNKLKMSWIKDTREICK